MITRAAITQLGIWVPWKNVEFEKPKVRRESAKQIFRRAKMKLGLTITIVWEFYLVQDSFHMPKFLCILTMCYPQKSHL